MQGAIFLQFTIKTNRLNNLWELKLVKEAIISQNTRIDCSSLYIDDLLQEVINLCYEI